MTAPAPPPPPRTVAAPSAPAPRRFDAPDLLRGLIMVIMLLDHTRDFVHYTGFQYEPTDLEHTTVALFLTRWITHFCAPLFVFLAGMAVAFQQQRGKSSRELSAFLFKRGLWLCAVELVVIRALIFWTVGPELFFLQVIWALGISMICLAVLVRLPKAVALVFGVALVVGHNALDGIQFATWNVPGDAVPSALAKVWFFIHQSALFPIAGWPGPVVFTKYPIVPWIGVMALGWLFGDVYTWRNEVRRPTLLKLGIALTAAFVLLRFTNVYGDPAPWSHQASAAFTALSFLNVTKYPPSLLFLLMTIGPGLLALAWFERNPGAPRGVLARALITFGRVPLFFYVLQWVYAKGAAYGLSVASGRDTSLLTQLPFEWQFNGNIGFSLPVTYAVWITGVLLLYWPCRWFAGVKARRRDWWLSYI